MTAAAGTAQLMAPELCAVEVQIAAMQRAIPKPGTVSVEERQRAVQEFKQFQESHAQADYSKKVDVYAYGVTLWEMAAHKAPWSDAGSSEVYERVVGGERPRMAEGAAAAMPAGYK